MSELYSSLGLTIFTPPNFCGTDVRFFFTETGRVTLVHILAGTFAYHGRALCHPNDAWDSDTGRKVAVRNALEIGNMGWCVPDDIKAIRRSIWHTFREYQRDFKADDIPA